MIERYSLLNIIVLGESLLAATLALGVAAAKGWDFELIRVAFSALLIVAAMWWMYFSREDHLQEESRSMAFTWGYGHVVIYLSGAAVGAGIAALVDISDWASQGGPVGG